MPLGRNGERDASIVDNDCDVPLLTKSTLSSKICTTILLIYLLQDFSRTRTANYYFILSSLHNRTRSYLKY